MGEKRGMDKLFDQLVDKRAKSLDIVVDLAGRPVIHVGKQVGNRHDFAVQSVDDFVAITYGGVSFAVELLLGHFRAKQVGWLQLCVMDCVMELLNDGGSSKRMEFGEEERSGRVKVEG